MEDDEWEDDELFTQNMDHIDAIVSQAYSQVTAGTSTTKVVKETFESPSKRLRIEKTEKEADEWEDDELFNKNMHQIDALACSQTSTTKVNLDSVSNVVKPWTSSVAAQPSTSVQHYEKQNQQLMNLHLGIKSTEEQLRSMSVSLAKNEQDLKVSLAEKQKLQQRVDALEHERNLENKQLQKLQKELDFKTHEASRHQWTQSPMRVVTGTTKEQPHSPKKQSLSRKRKDGASFPTIESFTQRAKSPTQITKEQESSSEKNDTKIIDRKKRTAEGIETGPGLVSLLLRETIGDSNLSLAEWTKKPSSSLGSDEDEVESLGLIRPNESPKKSALIVSNSTADLLSALIEMLQDERDVGDLESRFKWIPSDMPILLSRLGLRKDSAHVLLPAIEEILGALPLSTTNSTTTIINNNNHNQSSSTSTLSGHTLPVDIDSVYSGTTITSFQSLSSESRIQASMSLVTNALKLLRMIAYYSPKVRYCITTDTLLDAVDWDFDFRDVVNSEPTFECGSVDVCNEVSTLDSERVENGKKCLILSKLIKFCCQDSQRDDSDVPFFSIILDIFTAVSSYSSIEHLSRFIPLLSSLPMEKLTNLTLNGTVFSQLLAFLTATAASPNVIENYCIQDEFCLWILLSHTWQKARKTFPLNISEKLDFQMIILLSTCLTHEEQTPSFLASNDCHCPFEIATSVILYLHSQKTVYEESGSVPSLNTMCKGISLLYLLTQIDKNFMEHCSSVDAEFSTFLYWLPRVHKQFDLGAESSALMDMWNISPMDE